MVVINSETFIEYEIKNEGFKDFLMKLSLLTKGSWKHCAFGTPSENFIADLPLHYCLFPHRGSSQIIANHAYPCLTIPMLVVSDMCSLPYRQFSHVVMCQVTGNLECSSTL